MADQIKNVEMTSLASDHPETKVFTCFSGEVQSGLPAARYDKWAKDAQKRKETHPFEERRIGWIMPRPDYKVVCCGQSWGDLCMHFCGLMTDSFYSLFNVGFLWRKRSDCCYFVEYYFSRFRLGIVVTLFYASL